MYVITRRDLSTGMQFAQSCHAAMEWDRSYGRQYQDDNVIVLTVADEPALLRLQLDLIEFVGPDGMNWFEEPDLDDAITAIACPAVCKHKLRKLPLAGA